MSRSSRPHLVLTASKSVARIELHVLVVVTAVIIGTVVVHLKPKSTFVLGL